MIDSFLWSHAGLYAMGLGVLLGLVLLAISRTGAELGPSLSMRRRDLRAALTLAIENLRELDERGPRLAASEGAQERGHLESEAERLLAELRALERPETSTGSGPVRALPRSAAISYLAARPRLQGGLWGAGVAGVAVFLLTTVRLGAVPSTPGALAQGAAAGPQTASSIDVKELDALKETLGRQPNDVPALVRLGHLALQAQELAQADALTRQVLALAPDNVEAQVHAAVLQAGTGDASAALLALTALLQRYPGLAEAWFFRGMLSMQSGDMEQMQASFSQFVQVAPEGPQKERIRAMLARSRTQ